MRAHAADRVGGPAMSPKPEGRDSGSVRTIGSGWTCPPCAEHLPGPVGAGPILQRFARLSGRFDRTGR